MGSAFVLGAVAASASYIDAPVAVRSTFPKANPSIYLTSSLGITFTFMVLAGVPIVWQMAKFWQGLSKFKTTGEHLAALPLIGGHAPMGGIPHAWTPRFCRS
jgi:hypothetical protein